ncbi:MAG: hypothetical protein AVDCRST_MAG05-1223, partial [uncultured Rubrobacteraceae bacterium]
ALLRRADTTRGEHARPTGAAAPDGQPPTRWLRPRGAPGGGGRLPAAQPPRPRGAGGPRAAGRRGPPGRRL